MLDGEFEKALEFYEQAIKVRPEFPEAEFQRGNALVSLSRLDEADAAFRRAIALKKNWSLPYSALGALLMRRERDTEATPLSCAKLSTIDPQDNIALRLLSELRLRAGDPKEALELATRATQNPDAPTSAWIGLAIAERANGNKAALRKTGSGADGLTENVAALLERSDLPIDEKSYDSAIADLKTVTKVSTRTTRLFSPASHYAYQQAGRTDEAAAVAKAAGLEIQQSVGDDKIQGDWHTGRD